MNAKQMAVGEGGGHEPDYGTLKSHLDQFAEDNQYLESIRPELRNQYPNHWIAVYKKEVVGIESSLRRIVQHLLDKNIPPSRTVVSYLRKEPLALIL